MNFQAANKNVDVKRKKYNYKTVNRVCKRVKYMYWVKKRLVWVVLDRGERGKANETGLKEGGGIEMSTTVLHSRSIRFVFTYLLL